MCGRSELVPKKIGAGVGSAPANCQDRYFESEEPPSVRLLRSVGNAFDDTPTLPISSTLLLGAKALTLFTMDFVDTSTGL